ncbi:MAG: haloacid dehalogenase-like hydrolase, partial [Clostridia bacterium]|nr:haloacid dehalogenase-like hydrolase [Clostridia bacterium]
DIPAMRLTVKNGGHAIGVYNPDHARPNQLLELVRDNRINFYAPADYKEFSILDTIIKEIILKIKYSFSLDGQTQLQKEEAKKELV